MENVTIEKVREKSLYEKMSDKIKNYQFCEGKMLKAQGAGSNVKTFDISYIKMAMMAREQFILYVKILSKLTNIQESEGIKEYIKWANETPCVYKKELEERLSEGRFGSLKDFENSWDTITHLNSWLESNLEDWLSIFGGFENLTELTILDLSMCNDKQVPNNLELLEKLRYLDLGNPNITQLPNSVLELSSLTKLLLEYTGISYLPENLDKLSNLEFISLDCSKIKCLPTSILNLGKLETLMLSETSIDENDPIVISLTKRGVDVVF